MGLIKAAFGAAGGVMADQWKEFFYCEAIPADVLAVKGKKKVQREVPPAQEIYQREPCAGDPGNICPFLAV